MTSKVPEATTVPLTSEVPEVTKNKPPEWAGAEVILYHSFDHSDALVLWEGTQQIGEVPLVSGKVIMTIFGTDYQAHYKSFQE